MSLPTRRLKDGWLSHLGRLTEETEAPAHFWLWSGLFTLGAAMQRKVWIDYGFDKIFPNLYVFLVAAPALCRKGGPVKIAKKMLTAIDCHVSVDSTTKARFTQDLATCQRLDWIDEKTAMTHSSIALISAELSSLLMDLKPMIEALTDLYDNHEIWEYRTKNKGSDKIYGPCVSMLAASTPDWVSSNLPGEAIGGGFTSRIVIATGTEKKSRITFPEFETGAYDDLVHDLEIISLLKGKFEWEPQARAFFKHWYEHTIDEKYYKELSDDRFAAFLERLHVIVLKTAMCIHVSHEDTLVLSEQDMREAVALLEVLLPSLPVAFGSLGKSRSAYGVGTVLEQLKRHKTMTRSLIQKLNWRNLDHMELRNVLETIKGMNCVKSSHHIGGPYAGEEVFTWVEEGSSDNKAH